MKSVACAVVSALLFASSVCALPFNFYGGVDLPTSYVFRGYNIHDSGLQAQTDLNIAKTFDVNDSLTLTPHLGTWNNVTSENFGTSDDFSNWDESRVNAGVKLAKGSFALDTVYTYYAFPNDRNGDNSEVASTLLYAGDATSLFGQRLNPHFTVAYQVTNQDTDETVYFELGVEPQHKFDILGADVLFSLPITYGGSMDSYFVDDSGKNETSGFVEIGLHAKYQFTEHFDLHGGVDYYYLIADSAQSANNDSENMVVGSIGLGFSF